MRKTFLLLTFTLLPSLAVADQDLDAARRAVRMQDFTLAAEHYELAASRGELLALYELANLYMQGRGVPRDKPKALELLSVAASQNHAPAQYSLAMQLMDTDKAIALELLSKAADQGYAAARNYLERQTAKPDNSNTDVGRRWHSLARSDDISGMNQLLPDIPDINFADENGRTALHSAVQFNNETVARWLLSQGADANTLDRFQISPLADAVIRGNHTLVTLLLTTELNPQQTAPNGDSLVHLAVRQGDHQILLALASHDVPVNTVNKEGLSPLDIADALGDAQLISTLVSHGALHGDKWSRSRERDLSALQAARLENVLADQTWNIEKTATLVITGDTVLLDSVLGERPELVNRTLQDESSLLALAVKNHLPDVTRALLRAGASPDQAIYEGITPLHLAARSGDLEIIEILLESGANPLVRDEDNWDAMEWALRENQPSAATLLISRLIENTAGHGSAAPFDRYLLRASQFDMLGIVRVVLPYRTEDFYDKTGRTGLWFASRNGNVELVRLLLQAGVSVRPDEQGRSPLHVALQSNCLACARLLLPALSIDDQTQAGFTPLMIAVSSHSVELVQWCLDNQADVEARNAQGNTALILATEQGQLEIARLLLQADANVTRKNNVGISALDIARTNQLDLYELLREYTVLGLF